MICMCTYTHPSIWMKQYIMSTSICLYYAYSTAKLKYSTLSTCLVCFAVFFFYLPFLPNSILVKAEPARNMAEYKHSMNRWHNKEFYPYLGKYLKVLSKGIYVLSLQIDALV